MEHAYPLPPAESLDDRTPVERERQRRDFAAAYNAARRDLNPPPAVKHLAVVAFLAAMARSRGVSLVNADAIYVAGYYAKKEQLGRELYSYERMQLRSAADRVWSALEHLNAVDLSAHARVVTQGGMGNG